MDGRVMDGMRRGGVMRGAHGPVALGFNAGLGERVFCALEIDGIEHEVDVLWIGKFRDEIFADSFLFACEADLFEDACGIARGDA